MYHELIAHMGAQGYQVFFKDSLYSPIVPFPHQHKHSCAEIHILAGGTAVFQVENRRLTLDSGSILAIPGGQFHCCVHRDASARMSAFLINCKLSQAAAYAVGEETLQAFLEELEKPGNAQNVARISAYITLLGSYFCPTASCPVQPVTDAAFLITEFFWANYAKDLRMRDLAQVLHLSQRQTQRLVLEATGRTFHEELIAVRLNVAEQLRRTSDMTLREIAEYVGYRSYAGFWKAMKKHALILGRP